MVTAAEAATVTESGGEYPGGAHRVGSSKAHSDHSDQPYAAIVFKSSDWPTSVCVCVCVDIKNRPNATELQRIITKECKGDNSTSTDDTATTQRIGVNMAGDAITVLISHNLFLHVIRRNVAARSLATTHNGVRRREHTPPTA